MAALLGSGHRPVVSWRSWDGARSLGRGAAVAPGQGLREVETMALGLEGVLLVHDGDLAEGMRRLDEVSAAAVSGASTISARPATPAATS